MRKAIWDRMLTADMNVRYWQYLLVRYTRRDTIIKIFLAVTASSAVAGWGLWKEIELVWQSLSAMSAVLAIAQPILKYQERISAMSHLAGRWSELMVEYQELWYMQERGLLDDELSEKYEKNLSNFRKLQGQDSGFPMDRELLKKCQAEVIHSRKLKLGSVSDE